MLMVYEGKALALLYALRWVQQLDVPRVVFESDSKVVVNSLKGSRDDFFEFGLLIGECKSS